MELSDKEKTKSGLKKIYVLSQYLYDKMAKKNELNEDNVESFDVAFISTVNVHKYKDEGMKSLYDRENIHWFNENHSNVLNLEFDDVIRDNKDEYKAFSEEQAQEIIGVIDRNKNKIFLIHCLGGISRSRAIGQFLCDYYLWVDKKWFNKNLKPEIQPNRKVYNELKKKFQLY
jgi:predicted protein tyrosine phosphatase